MINVGSEVIQKSIPNESFGQSVTQTNSTKKRVAVIGASGYGGIQTLRLLHSHPNFEATYLGGHRSVGKYWNDLCNFLYLDNNLLIKKPDPDEIANYADYVILSLPNGKASQIVPSLIKNGLKVIDLSADYRYRSLDKWKSVYVSESSQYKRDDYELCNEAIYGLPEWNSSKIKKAKIVAAPGCFPTASLLPLLPFLKQGLVDHERLIIDAKTGTSGGGRNPKEGMLLSEAAESISPYGVIGHRHTSEIEQFAGEVAGKKVELQFTPHLVPMVRGLLATVYATLRDPGLTADDCKTVLEAIYRDSKCVKLLPVGTYPSTKWVTQTNMAYLSVQVDSRNGTIILMCAIDNLIKGQAGQAIQNLNLFEELPAETGLPVVNFYP